MARKDFATITSKIIPWLGRAEKMLKPRLTFLVHPPVEYLIGFLCLVLAIVLALPVPLGNILPALAICLFSFAILERDGLFAILGFIPSVISAIVVSGVVYGIIKALIYLVSSALM